MLLGAPESLQNPAKGQSAADAHRHQHRSHAHRRYRLEPTAELYGHWSPGQYRQSTRAARQDVWADIIIGEDRRSAAGDAIIVRRLDRVAGYGRTGGLAIYELLGMAADVGGTEAPEWVRTFESGLSAYEDRSWSRAISLFEATAALRNGDDRPSRILVEQRHACLAHPPPEEWLPISVLESKS
jgi:hypothetical protein